MITTIITFLVVLVILVVVHELGHFATAKAFRIKVHEFGLGYPPKLIGLRLGETLYSLNLLPLGGFVRLAGENDPNEPRSLAGKGIGTRAIVLFAGSLMNVILPVFIFAALFMVPQHRIEGFVQIKEVKPDSPAAHAGLQSKDIILKVDGKEILNTADLQYRIQLRLGATSTWLIKRGSEMREIGVVPRWRPPEGQGPTGITVDMIAKHRARVSYPFWEAVPRAFLRVGEILVFMKNEITRWIIGSGSPQLAGPIGIAQITGEVARAGGIIPLLEFTALLSINLAILNILPIPMLDGGRLFFIAIEWVRKGKRIPPEKEGFVHAVGFALLITLVVVISYFDILRILKGESFLR